MKGEQKLFDLEYGGFRVKPSIRKRLERRKRRIERRLARKRRQEAKRTGKPIFLEFRCEA